MKSFVRVLVYIVVVVAIGGLTYGGWLIKREVNYSMDYKAKVLETINEQNAPLIKRILELEKEVNILKQKEGK